MKRKKRSGIVPTAVALVFLIALEVFLCIWLFGARYPEFDPIASPEAKIPGLDGGLCPQGLCEVPQNPEGYRFAVSGYLSGGPSRVYLTGGEKEPKYITLKDGEGKDISTHFGGIACTGNYFTVASGKELVRFPVEEALSAENGAAVTVTDSLHVEDVRSVAYCYYYDGYLYAGEFYRPGNYETDESHHREVDGGTNYGLIFAYPVDEGAEGGVKSASPEFVISVREQVQGMAVWEGGIALSTSYGLPDSKIFFYRPPEEPAAEYGGIPLYVLDGSNCTRELTAPCMSEEICSDGQKLFVLFESMSGRYKNFVRRQVKDILSIPLA